MKTFYFKGDKVADDYADLYDGSWDPANPRNEQGGELTPDT